MRLLQELLMKARAAMRRTRVEREMEGALAEHLVAETENWTRLSSAVNGILESA